MSETRGVDAVEEGGERRKVRARDFLVGGRIGEMVALTCHTHHSP